MFCRCCKKRRVVENRVLCRRCADSRVGSGRRTRRHKTVRRRRDTFRLWIESERRRRKCTWLVCSRDKEKMLEGFHSFDRAWQFACNGADQPADDIYIVGERARKKEVQLGDMVIVMANRGGLGQVWPIREERCTRYCRSRMDTLTPTAKEQTKRKLKPKQKKDVQYGWRKDRWLHYQIDGAYRPIQVDAEVVISQSSYTCPQWSRVALSDGSWPVNMVRDTRVGPEDIVANDSHAVRFHEIMKG